MVMVHVSSVNEGTELLYISQNAWIHHTNEWSRDQLANKRR